MSESTDLEIVRQVLDGDTEAFRVLVERYQQRVYAVAYGIVRDARAAREVAQETFVTAHRTLDRCLSGRSSFSTWLQRITMSKAIDHARRAPAAGEGEQAESPDDPTARERQRARVLAALDKLPAEQRQILLLREVDGHTYAEIACILEMQEGAVISRLFFARKALRTALAQES